MWSKTAYWARGAVICMPLGILFFILLSIFQKFSDPWWIIIAISIIPGLISGIIVGGFIGSIFDLIKNKKVAPLIIFAIIIIISILSQLIKGLF